MIFLIKNRFVTKMLLTKLYIAVEVFKWFIHNFPFKQKGGSWW